MMPVFEYVHAIDGRMRVKVPEVKRSVAHARRVEEMFRPVEGVLEVRANPVTGNVLFLFDSDRLAGREILAALIAAGYMGMGVDGTPARPETVGEIAQVVAELIGWVLGRACKEFLPTTNVIEPLIEAAVRFLLERVLGRAAAVLA